MPSELKKLKAKLTELQEQLKLDRSCYADSKEELKDDPCDADLKEACADWRMLIADDEEEIREIKAAIALE